MKSPTELNPPVEPVLRSKIKPKDTDLDGDGDDGSQSDSDDHERDTLHKHVYWATNGFIYYVEPKLVLMCVFFSILSLYFQFTFEIPAAGLLFSDFGFTGIFCN